MLAPWLCISGNFMTNPFSKTLDKCTCWSEFPSLMLDCGLPAFWKKKKWSRWVKSYFLYACYLLCKWLYIWWEYGKYFSASDQVVYSHLISSIPPSSDFMGFTSQRRSIIRGPIQSISNGRWEDAMKTLWHTARECRIPILNSLLQEVKKKIIFVRYYWY